MNQVRLKKFEKKIIRRYLIWCYKTTKESLDRIDRKFTQLKVDQNVLDLLMRERDIENKKELDYLNKIKAFKEYIHNKERSAAEEKFSDTKQKVLNTEYRYLKNRLAAVEKTISKFLGKKTLEDIQNLYETELVRRILEAREH